MGQLCYRLSVEEPPSTDDEPDFNNPDEQTLWLCRYRPDTITSGLGTSPRTSMIP